MSWEMNANEFLKLIRLSGLPSFLQEPKPEDVGRVVFTQLGVQKREDPHVITDMGKLLHCCKEGEKVQLPKQKKGKKIISHEDGDDGEVFVASYFNRRIPKKWKVDKLKSLFGTRE